MFTTKYLDEIMAGPLGSPQAFCESLRLRPDDSQAVFLERFGGLPRVVDASLDEMSNMLRAALVCVLWRTMALEGSRGIIVAPSDESARSCMLFLDQVLTLKYSPLAEITKIPRWNVVKVGTAPDWEVRLLPNKVSILEEYAPKTQTALIVNAGSTVGEFPEVVKALQEGLTDPRSCLIRLW